MEATERKDEILAQALELLREVGLAGITVKKIADRVGFTEAALYRHFASKRDLVLEMMRSLDRDLLDPARAIAARVELPAEERLHLILEHHFLLIRERDSLPLMLLAEASASRDPEFLGRMRDVFTGYLAVITDLVEQARPTPEGGIESDAEARGLMVLGAAAGAAIRHRLLEDAAEALRIERSLIPLLIEGIVRSDTGSKPPPRKRRVTKKAGRRS